jgi:GTP-binding protein YchF
MVVRVLSLRLLLGAEGNGRNVMCGLAQTALWSGGQPLSPGRLLDRPGDSGFTTPVNITLFGYPKTGKTTLFNLLAGAHIEVKAYEDGKREPNVRACHVPDARLERIAALYPEKKKIPASFDLTDLVGISFGEVKTSLFLSTLRKADGLVHVVRAFRDDEIPHPKGRIDPSEDIRFMEEELVLADLVAADGRLERLEKDLKKMKDPEGEKEKELLERLRPALESGQGLRSAALPTAEEKLIRSFAFLSLKPLLHFINLDEQDTGFLAAPGGLFPVEQAGRRVMAFCGKIENEIAELDEAEKESFMAGYGLREPSAARFYAQAVSWLDRISFFTIGKDEVRAWTVKKGSSALKAAGAIHTDIERGFIRAEVISSDDLLKFGSLQHAKDAGAIRLEGRDYLVQDGDVIYFRFAP